MNQNKKNNGWILCPSKTFPGKFYYFNVLNGEAAWSLTEAENKALRKDTTIHKITDKSHTFPEPASPPVDASPITSNCNMANLMKTPEFVIPSSNIFPKIPQSQSTMFGQAVFPKYVANMESCIPNIVWIPTQVPRSLYMPNVNDVGRKLNRCTQTERDLFVHTCDIPLSQRFTKNKQEIKHRSQFKNNYAPSQSNVLSKQIFTRPDTPKLTSMTTIRQPFLKRVRTQSENDKFYHESVYKTNSEESVLSYENSASRQSTSDLGNRVDNTSKETDEEILENLERNDLRYLLVAKRRKSLDLGILQASEGKKIKTVNQPTPAETVKKHVTFNLQNQEYDSLEDMDSIELHSEEAIKINRNTWNLDNDLCYIIVDAYTLIDDFDLIEQYILSDDKRRLLLPSFIRALVEACCSRECRSRTRVIAARRTARKLASNNTYVVTLTEDQSLGLTVLECCVAIMKENYEVVLITGDIEIRVEAASNKIKCLTPRQIKDSADSVNVKPTFDFKIRVQNETNNKNLNNLFLQQTTEIKPYIFDNRDFPVNSFKTCLFEKPEDIKKTIINKIVDDTSPIKADNLRRTFANMSKINEENILNYESTSTATTDIRIDLQNLFIKENKKTAAQKTENVPVFKKPQILNAERAENDKLIIERNFEKRTPNFEIQKQQEKVSEAKSLSQKSLETKKVFNDIERDCSIEDCLKKYSIKSNVVEERINERLEEFICTFTQVLEDALTYLVLRHTPITDRLSPPWVLYGLIEMVRKLYESNAKVKSVAETLTSLLIKESNKIGKLRITMQPNDFMKIFGCGCLFIQALRIIQPNYEELSTAEVALDELLKRIESSSEDCEAPTFQTPIFSRPDVEMLTGARQNFVKKPSEIIGYLKRHFVEWESYKLTSDEQSYEESEQHQEHQNVDVKIFRTYGRNLSLLKLDKTKSMTINNPTDATVNVTHGNTNHEIVQDTDTTIDVVHNCSNETKTDIEKKSIYAEEDKNIEKFKKKFGIETLPKPTFDGCFSTSYGNTKDELATSQIIDLKNIPKTTKVVDLLDPGIIINNKPKITRRFDSITKSLNAFNTLKDHESYSKINNNNENFTYKSVERSMPLFNIEDLNIPQHRNTFNDETAGPKVIRNIKAIESFEGKIKENVGMDLDALDYTAIDENFSADTVVISNNEIKNDDMSIDESVSFVYEIKNKTFRINDSKNFETSSENLLKDYKISETLIIYDDSNLNNDSTNDSGFENESLHAHSLVKTFLAELSSSFKDIYKFIDKSIIEVRNDLPENKKRVLHDKASETRVMVAEIIKKLKRIIHRELNESTTLKELLMKAGVNATADKRITRYRQVVTKCLEQAQMLESALKLMLSITDGHTDNYSDSINTSIRYFNIFE